MNELSTLQLENQLSQALSRWEQTYRADAKADDYRLFRTLLQSLELPDEPTLLLDGTITVVRLSAAFLGVDGRDAEDFLSQQQYDPTKVTGIPYAVIFNIHSKAYARIHLPASLTPLDLADLYGAPWEEYERVGFCDFWISRIDGAALSLKEIAAFEKLVDYDLRFDYTEDELTFWFDPDSHEGILKVTVQDVFYEEQ